jgi:hypothetical protein
MHLSSVHRIAWFVVCRGPGLAWPFILSDNSGGASLSPHTRIDATSCIRQSCTCTTLTNLQLEVRSQPSPFSRATVVDSPKDSRFGPFCLLTPRHRTQWDSMLQCRVLSLSTPISSNTMLNTRLRHGGLAVTRDFWKGLSAAHPVAPRDSMVRICGARGAPRFRSD